MANEFALEMALSGGASLTEADVGPVYPIASFEIGSTVDELSFELEDGTAAGQANDLYFSRQTIAAAGTFTLNLFGGTLSNFMGEAINWTKLKGVLVVIKSPDGTKKFTIGPDGGATPMQAWFNATTAGQKTHHNWFEFKVDTLGAGWAVAAANDCLYINNPGAGSIDVDVIAWGVK